MFVLTFSVVLYCDLYTSSAHVYIHKIFSPDLNPIEHCFSQYKEYLRRYTTGDHIISADIHLGALQCVTRANMLNYYSALGIRNLVNNEDEDEVMAMVVAASVWYMED